ncbi:hypothetical protein, partial [Glycomyces tenuis]|uniref:hypothetical protein n=2 Tax=Glycomyces tenuis TaxID=58116 RepID=UPI001B808766
PREPFGVRAVGPPPRRAASVGSGGNEEETTMRGMRRYSRWIALAVVIAMAAPFLAQGLGALLSIEPVYVAAALLAATVLAIVLMARPRDDEEED